MKSPKRFANRTLKDLRDEALKLINQRAGTTRDPGFGLVILEGWMKGGRETKEDYVELIEFLEAGEPAVKTRAYERLSTSFQQLLEKQDMATKKTAAKKTSGFGNDKPNAKPAKAPKPAVERPKVASEKKTTKFVPTTPEELEEIANAAKAREAAAKKSSAKEAANTKASKKSGAKPAAEKAAPVGRKSRVNGDAKITVLAKENPKREGSGAHERFAKYKTGMTVAKALELGVTAADISYDSKHEYIKLG